jgi:hypothetical protein
VPCIPVLEYQRGYILLVDLVSNVGNLFQKYFDRSLGGLTGFLALSFASNHHFGQRIKVLLELLESFDYTHIFLLMLVLVATDLVLDSFVNPRHGKC